MMNIERVLLSIGLAVLLAACGGGSGEDDATSASGLATEDAAAQALANAGPSATSLTYTDPTGTGWRLVKDASSTASRIVLNLVGPAGVSSRGVGFNLKRGPGVVFGKFADGGYAANPGVFELKGSNPNFEPYAGTDADPVLFVSAPLKSGDVLSTGIFQKDRTRSPKDLTQPLLQVAVELPGAKGSSGISTPGPAIKVGQALALTVVKARMVPADIGAMDFILTTEAIAKARMVDISVEVGRLVAK